MSKLNDDNDKTIINWGIASALIILVLWGITYLLLVDKEPDDRGTLGDMFGTINALFSGLALAGIIFTILLQRKELGYQRDELRETRKEFKIQNETLRQQRFENTLFQLIGIHHEVIDKLSFQPQGLGVNLDIVEKREMLAQAVKDLQAQLKSALIEDSTDEKSKITKSVEPQTFEEAYEKLTKGYHKFYFELYKQVLSHYFRNIYHVFKFIYTSDLIKPEQLKFYSSIARAQLSSDELFLIFYNSLIPDLGYPNFLFLAKELDIMQNFDFELISEFKFHREIYNKRLNSAKPEFTEPNRCYE